MRKGQSALEYLLTYGWAILIVIIVGASLYALGVFSPGQWTGKRQTGFAQFRVADFSLNEDGNFSIAFQNQLGKTVTLNNIYVYYKNVECTLTNGTTAGNIAPNEMYVAWGDCDTTWGVTLTARTSYSLVVDFDYTDPDSGIDHRDSGTLFGAVEAT